MNQLAIKRFVKAALFAFFSIMLAIILNGNLGTLLFDYYAISSYDFNNFLIWGMVLSMIFCIILTVMGLSAVSNKEQTKS